MPRFLKVRGKPGLLVAHPGAMSASPRRYAGQQFDAGAPADAKTVERYLPVEEVLEDGTSLRRAIGDGELDLVGECVAKNHADTASAQWLVKTAPAPVKVAKAERKGEG